MPRKKKDSIALNINVDREIMERFNKYCDDVGQTKTLAFERIISKFLDEFYKSKEK